MVKIENFIDANFHEIVPPVLNQLLKKIKDVFGVKAEKAELLKSWMQYLGYQDMVINLKKRNIIEVKRVLRKKCKTEKKIFGRN